MSILIILIATLIFYLPVFIKPEIFLARHNDLTEFFWPIYHFVKNQIITGHQIPLWNSLFLSGTPLLPDPQSPLFYLPNVIYLFVPIGAGFILSSFLHTFAGGIGAYLLAKELKFSKLAAVATSVFYLASPKLAGFIEAGHVGLINSLAWIPFVFLFTVLIVKKPKLKYSIGLSVFLALIFFSHTAIFLYALGAVTLLLIANRKFLFLGLTLLFTFGLTAVSLLPQLEWQNQTTRQLLLNDRDTYPKWLGKKEFIKALILPSFYGKNFIRGLDSEKWIAVGTVLAFLSFLGFLKLKRRH
ncbi:MAG: hypothetical protein UX13_C0009G0016, partial [Candidatus Woesebacteria bacterium GW2011_GWB1_45_5]